MPYKSVVSKIRCVSPNKKNAAASNIKNLEYIATRSGTSLEPLEIELKNFNNEDSTNELYVNYISERPKSHGLFGNIETESLKDVSSHIYDLTKKGTNIYRGIISISEQDSIELGFDNKEKWNSYLQNTLPDVANVLGISIKNLEWVSAFHQERSHPHCHYLLWDKEQNIKNPFISIPTQHKCREVFSEQLFKEERIQSIENKSIQRDQLINKGKGILDSNKDYILFNKISPKFSEQVSKEISEKLVVLATEIENENRFAYKYLSPSSKEKVDQVVEQLLKIPTLKNEYQEYIKYQSLISDTLSVTKNKKDFQMISADQDIRIRISNKILKTCKEILVQRNNIINDGLQDPFESLSKTEPLFNNNYDESFEKTINDYEDNENIYSKNYICEWSNSYKEAMTILYSKEEKKDIDKLFFLLKYESKRNNVLALNELGKLYENGILVEKNIALANNLYKKCFDGFHQLKDLNEKKSNYFYYRLGKCYQYGKGTDQNYLDAIEYYKKSANNKNKYAQYSLANMYIREQGIEITDENREQYLLESYDLLEKSAIQGFPYAMYQLAALSEKNNLLSYSKKQIEDFYKMAFNSFNSEKEPSDDIEFKLGIMNLKGKGTEINIDNAYKHLCSAISLENKNAKLTICDILLNKDSKFYDEKKAFEYLNELAEQEDYLGTNATYKLGLIYKEKESSFYDIEKSIICFEKAAAENHDMAFYQLGMIYKDISSKKYDLEKSINYLEKASEKNNDIATYQLGMIYKKSGSKFFDINKSIEYLEKASEKNNDIATYNLGKLYYDLREKNSDNLEKAIFFLKKSAENKNHHSQYLLGNIYSNKNFPQYNINTSLMYYEKSIQNGNAYSMEKVGLMYLYGSHKDIPRNVELGLKYINQAKSHGSENAQIILDNYKNITSSSVGVTLLSSLFRTMGTQTQRSRNNYNIEKLFKKHSKEIIKEEMKRGKDAFQSIEI